MNKLLIGLASACAMTLSVTAMAGGLDTNSQNMTTGFYVLGQAGYGWDDGFSKNTSDTDALGIKYNQHKNGFAGRVGAGYQFNPYLGLQAGFTYLPQYKYEVKTDNVSGSVALNFWALDLMAVATLPINDSFFIYGAAGGAYVHESADVTALSGVLSENANLGKDSYVRPKLAAGAGYKINQNVALTVEYAHIFERKADNNHFGVPSFDTVMAGVQYTF